GAGRGRSRAALARTRLGEGQGGSNLSGGRAGHHAEKARGQAPRARARRGRERLIRSRLSDPHPRGVRVRGGSPGRSVRVGGPGGVGKIGAGGRTRARGGGVQACGPSVRRWQPTRKEDRSPTATAVEPSLCTFIARIVS